jgi:hypothetical protein
MANYHTYEELDTLPDWTVEDASRYLKVCRQTGHRYVRKGQLVPMHTDPIRLKPAHVKKQQKLGFPIIAPKSAA